MTKLIYYSILIIIISMASLFLIFKFENNVAEAYKKLTAHQTCKTSVLTHAGLKMRYADFSSDIKCPTIRLEIGKIDESRVKKKLADAMYDCWDQYGKGQLDLFKDDSIYCSICHRISLDKSIKVTNFADYLATNYPKGEKISYLQFLSTERTDNSEFLKEIESRKVQDNIDAAANNEYAIVFTYIKGRKNIDRMINTAKFTAPGVGTMLFGIVLIKFGGSIAAASTLSGPGAAIGVPLGGIATATGTALLSLGFVWSYVGYQLSGVPFDHISTINFIPYDAQNLQSFGCIDVPVTQT